MDENKNESISQSNEIKNNQTEETLDAGCSKSSLKSILKSQSDLKKTVQFSKTDLYYFERCQGHLSIPSSDNDSNSITLGMIYSHSDYNSFETQEEFLKFKRKIDLDRIEELLETIGYDQLCETTDPLLKKAVDVILERDLYEKLYEQELGVAPDIMCPILSLEQRKEKLLKLGYLADEIDKSESEDINLIRESRQECGCDCNKMNMVCGENGDLCSCYANGINCQIDRLRYPCSCSVKKCKNQFGMKRFNPKAVLDHYKKVLHKNNQQDEETKTFQVKKSRGRKRKSKQHKINAKRKKIESNDSIEVLND